MYQKKVKHDNQLLRIDEIPMTRFDNSSKNRAVNKYNEYIFYVSDLWKRSGRTSCQKCPTSTRDASFAQCTDCTTNLFIFSETEVQSITNSIMGKKILKKTNMPIKEFNRLIYWIDQTFFVVLDCLAHIVVLCGQHK